MHLHQVQALATTAGINSGHREVVLSRRRGQSHAILRYNAELGETGEQLKCRTRPAGAVLADHHREALARSGIDLERAASRGYETIDNKRCLAELKVTPAGRNVPGLLVPLLDVRGSVWGHQYRPDVRGCRTTATGSSSTRRPPASATGSTSRAVSAPSSGIPGSRCLSPRGPRRLIVLWRTDCAVWDLPGVWSFRGTNNLGGKVAIARLARCRAE